VGLSKTIADLALLLRIFLDLATENQHRWFAAKHDIYLNLSHENDNQNGEEVDPASTNATEAGLGTGFSWFEADPA
jgi:hypothetical protein